MTSHLDLALSRVPKERLYELDRDLFTVSEAALPSGTNAFVKLGQLPYEIVLNNRIEAGRKEIALAHELLHVVTELTKVHLEHDQLHVLAVFLITEIIPTIVRYRMAKEHGV